MFKCELYVACTNFQAVLGKSFQYVDILQSISKVVLVENKLILLFAYVRPLSEC